MVAELLMIEVRDGMNERVGTLEQKVAEHEIRLENACTTLERVADKLDKVSESLAQLVGEEAGRARFINMWMGASVTALLALVTYYLTT